MLFIFQIVLLVLVQVGLFWLVKKKLPGFSLGTILVLIISGLAGFTLLAVHSLRCWVVCPTSPLSSADLGVYAIPIALFDLIILGVIFIFGHTPGVSKDAENPEPTFVQTNTTPTSGDSDEATPLLAKESQSFRLVMPPKTRSQYYHDLNLVGKLVIFSLALIQIFVLFEKIPLFTFPFILVSFLGIVLCIHSLWLAERTRTTVFLYIFVFVLASGYITYIRLSGATETIPSTPQSAFPSPNTGEQGIIRAIPSWCHVFRQGLSYGAYVQEVSEFQKALRLSGFFINDEDGLFHNSTVEATKKFQKAQGLLQTGTLESDTRVTLNKLYGCGTASDYGLAFGHADADVSSITNAATRFSGIVSGSILDFDITDPPLQARFISKEYKGGAPIDTEFAPPDYSFATNFSGDKKILKDAVCGSQNTLIDCKELPNGYVAYFVQKSSQSPQISLYAEAAVSTGSSQFPTAFVLADFNDSTLNESYDATGALVFPDQPPLNQEMYIKGVTADYKNPTSSLASKVKSLEEFVVGIKGKEL